MMYVRSIFSLLFLISSASATLSGVDALDPALQTRLGADADIDPILFALEEIRGVLVSAADDRAAALVDAKSKIQAILDALPDQSLFEGRQLSRTPHSMTPGADNERRFYQQEHRKHQPKGFRAPPNAATMMTPGQMMPGQMQGGAPQDPMQAQQNVGGVFPQTKKGFQGPPPNAASMAQGQMPAMQGGGNQAPMQYQDYASQMNYFNPRAHQKGGPYDQMMNQNNLGEAESNTKKHTKKDSKNAPEPQNLRQQDPRAQQSRQFVNEVGPQ